MIDTTQKIRIARRRKLLLEKAVSAGWLSWSEFETAVINGATQLPLAPDSGYAPAKKALSNRKPARGKKASPKFFRRR